ncbi:hypothetical protein JW890_09070 [candidate division WOR-3 bacterium]|nr:hypothetical protein [candidate division WOR-3 bacterium]
MDYVKVKSILDNLENYEKGVQRFFEPDLDRVLSKVRSLPLKKRKKIKIVGTNGKGSICAMLESSLVECGLKTLSFTSPHLQDELERIKIDGRNVTEEFFAEAFTSLFGESEIRFTYFETLFLCALWIAEANDSDVVLLEAGMGGKLDATNCVDSDIILFASISLDHTEVLGETFLQIALDKAGAINKSSRVVSSLGGPVREILQLRALLTCSEFFSAEDLTGVFSEKSDLSGTSVHCEKFGEIYCPLKGKFQRDNILTALGALELLKDEFSISNESVRKGILKVKNPGRLQYITENPLKIIDGSHNPSGVGQTVLFIREYHPGIKFDVYFSAMKDKDFEGMMEILEPITDSFIFPDNLHKRSADTLQLSLCARKTKKFFRVLGGDEFFSDFIKNPSNSIATGSMKTVGGFLKALTRQGNDDNS